MSNISWRKLGNYRPDGDMYLMNVFSAIWMSEKIECEKGEAVLFADVEGFDKLLDDIDTSD